MKALAAEGSHEEAISAGNSALELVGNIHGPNSQDAGNILFELGNLHYRKGDKEAAERFLSRALKVFDRPDREQPGLLPRVLNNLGYVLTDLDRYAEAERILLRLVQVLEKPEEQETTLLGTVYKNLGRLYARWSRPEAAESSFRTSLSILERESQANEWLIDGLVNDMAAFYREQGRFDEAEAYYRRALGLRRSRYGSNHQKVVDTLYDFIGLFEAQGRFGELEPFYRQLVAIFEKWPDSPGYPESLAGLAHALTIQERYEEAELLLREALEISIRIHGGASLEAAEAHYKLAFPAYRKGDYEVARTRYLRALDAFDSAVPSDHIRHAEVRKALASSERNLGNLKQAEAWYRDALRRFERIGGTAHRGWRTTALDLLTLLAARDDMAELDAIVARYLEGSVIEEDVDRLLASFETATNEAWSREQFETTEQLLDRAISIAERHAAREHPKRATLQLDLGNLLARIEREDQAEAAFQRAIESFGEQEDADPALLARAQLLLAGQWADAMRDEQAAAMLELALGNFEHSENSPPGGILTALSRLAEIRTRQGDYAAADAMFERALTLSADEYGPASVEFAALHEHWAYMHKDRGNYEEAERLFRRSMALNEDAGRGDTSGYADAAEGLAYLLYDRNRYLEAEPLFDRVLTIRLSLLGDVDPRVADTLIALGDLRTAIGNYGLAREAYDRALTVREQVYPASHDAVIWAMERQARLAGNSGDLAREEQIRHDILGRLKRADKSDHRLFAKALRDLALLQQHRNRLDDAENYAAQALSTDELVFGRKDAGVVESLALLASVYFAQRRFFDAAALQLDRLAILEAQPNTSSTKVAAALRDLAKVKHALGADTEAVELIEKGFQLSVIDGEKGPASRAGALRQLGMDYLAFGRWAEGEEALLQALELDEMVFGADHLSVTMDLLGMASARAFQGDSRGAIEVSERAWNAMSSNLGPGHPFVDMVSAVLPFFYIAEGRMEDAERVFEEVLPKYRSFMGEESELESAASIWQAVVAIKRGRTSEAIEHLRRHVALLQSQVVKAQSAGSGSPARRDIGRIGQLLLVATLERAARKDASLRRNLIDEAFKAVQIGNIGTTAAAVARMAARFALDDDELGHLVRQRQDAAEHWLFLNTRLIEAAGKPLAKRNHLEERAAREKMAEHSAAINALDLELKRQFPEYAELVQPQPAAISEVQELLAPDEALLFYRTFQDFEIGAFNEQIAELVPARTLLFLVRRDHSELLWIDATPRQLEKQVADLRRALDFEGEQIPHFDRRTAFQLYSQLFAGAEKLLTGVAHVMVVPDGALQSLPFGVLITEKPAGPFFDFSRYAQVPWLADKYAITTIPSVSSLRALRRTARRASAQVAFAGFGNPILQGQSGVLRGFKKTQRLFRGSLADVAEVRQLPPLPDTEDELRAIAKALQAGDDAVFVRGDATETTVKTLNLSDRRVLAFATHGLVAGDISDVAEPALVLTPPRTATPLDDGLLTASEITRLDLNAEWVILSACNTAAPGAEGAEGLSGLAKAFFFAGSRALLVSHWPVDSEASVRITTGIFDAMRQDPRIGRSEALRRATQALISDRDEPYLAHPFFWAPFVVVGEGGTAPATAAANGN